MNTRDFTLYHVFTGPGAKGNPAAVQWCDRLPNFSEHLHLSSPCKTRVYVQQRGNLEFNIRWMNDTNNIKRCGHGTLAAAAHLAQGDHQQTLTFFSEHEKLTVTVTDSAYKLRLNCVDLTVYPDMALPFKHDKLLCTQDPQGYIMAELDSGSAIRAFTLNPTIIKAMGQRALIITTQETDNLHDIMFRYFAPQYGSAEDDATGSAASVLWPFWRQRLTKKTLKVYQASPRGGYYQIRGGEHWVELKGQALTIDSLYAQKD